MVMCYDWVNVFKQAAFMAGLFLKIRCRFSTFNPDNPLQASAFTKLQQIYLNLV